QEVGAGVAALDRVAAASALHLQAGRWAWGVVVDDGTDSIRLVDGVQPDRSYRTFVRDTAPVFLLDPSVGVDVCGLGQQTPGTVLAFSYVDDNGVETVNVTLTYATNQASVFDNPLATLALAAGDLDGDIVVSLQNLGAPDCPEFAHDAGFYGVELSDGVNDPVQGIVEYAPVIPTGACCASDGTCSEGFLADCVGGSTFEGDGTTCATVQCPQPPPPLVDCNGNTIPDDQDIANETSLDCNLNGVPDECEGSPIGVEAGTLNPGLIDLQSFYDSSPNNDLIGSICPDQGAAQVVWTVVGVPPNASIVDVVIRTPGSLASVYRISPAREGDYVFQLTVTTVQGVAVSDTVTLTLSAQ
ncbi:MAG: hypothetical protein IIB60_04050, partial [Planctomycetes bacterium]|nr:hypothetical protein [Planctomycetota bacterium]